MTSNSNGKASPGSPFRVPPAVIWNNMVDAGQAYAASQLSKPTPESIRPRSTDIIKALNSSEAARRKGDVLKISGKAIEDVTDENIWLDGVEPTADCYFGILKEPANEDEVVSLQVSGVCIAIVDISDTDHTRANIEAGSYVLASSDGGPIEILYAPSSTGEQDCVVRFGGYARLTVVLDEALDAATNALTTPGTATASVLRKNSSGNLEDSGNNIEIVNRYESIDLEQYTIGVAAWIDGEWRIDSADCTALGDWP